MALIDLTGQRFGRLIVIKRDISKPKGHGKPVYWICKCDCGTIKSVKACHLKDGSIQSCGCLHKEIVSKIFTKDITNQKFDYLTAIKPLYVNNHKETVWLCECDCGNLCEKSIGELNDDRRIKHCGHLFVKSVGEEKIKDILDKNNISYKREYSFPDLKGDKLPLRFDFAIFDKNEKLAYLIEYNGIFHYKEIEGFSTKENLEKQQKYDKLKKDYCSRKSITLLTFNNLCDIIKEKIILEEYL